MAKVEVTDEMVERAGAFIVKRGLRYLDCTDSDMRGILEAALSPPPEPEIEVTRPMADAGGAAWRACREVERGANRGLCGVIGWSTNEFAERIYRAMESERRKGEKAHLLQGAETSEYPCRICRYYQRPMPGSTCGRDGCGTKSRRKDDP